MRLSKILRAARAGETRYLSTCPPVASWRRDGSRAPFKPRSFLLSLISTHTSFQTLFNEAMMSLVATPIVAARIAACAKGTQTVAASSADQPSLRGGGRAALTMLAQPALAMNELGHRGQAGRRQGAAARGSEPGEEEPRRRPEDQEPRRGPPRPRPSISAPPWAAAPSPRRGQGSEAAPAEKIEYVVFRHSHCRGANAAARAARARPPSRRRRRARSRRGFSRHARSVDRVGKRRFLVSSPDFSLRRRSRRRGAGQARLRDGHPVLPLLAVAGLSLQTPCAWFPRRRRARTSQGHHGL